MFKGIFIATLTSTTLLAMPIFADHDSFEYSGRRHGVHGEKRIIEALSFIELARLHGPTHCNQYLRHASDRSQRAYHQVCHPTARYYIRGALEHIQRYSLYFRLCDLEDAAQLLNKAIIIEHEAHHGPHIQPAPPIARPTVVVPRYEPIIARPVTHPVYWGGYSRGSRGRSGFGFSISF